MRIILRCLLLCSRTVDFVGRDDLSGKKRRKQVSLTETDPLSFCKRRLTLNSRSNAESYKTPQSTNNQLKQISFHNHYSYLFITYLLYLPHDIPHTLYYLKHFTKMSMPTAGFGLHLKDHLRVLAILT